MSLISYTHFIGVDDSLYAQASVFVFDFTELKGDNVDLIFQYAGKYIFSGNIVVFLEEGVPKRWFIVDYYPDEPNYGGYKFVDVTKGVPEKFMYIKNDDPDFWNLPKAPAYVKEFIENNGMI